ncbi:MAG: hypothetical protein RL226_176 [Bacteroidota bacterium]|jgi:gliding motility-associated-like protein
MYRLFAFIISIALSTYALGQISNGGFEDNEGFPSALGQWEFVDNWNNAQSNQGTPDYYHSNGTLAGDLPETPLALVDPYQGNAIMGFIASGHIGTGKREYLVNELNEALVPGQKYNVSFYICNGYITDNSFAGLSTSDIGVCFTSNQPVQSGSTPLSCNPQFTKSQPFYSREWTKFSFSFIAEEGYEFMTIGVFKEDDEITVNVVEGNNPQVAYYFVDDFTIEVIPNEFVDVNDQPKGDPSVVDENENPEVLPGFFVPNAFTPNDDGENDIFKPIMPEVSNYKLSIFSRWGDLIFTSMSPEEGWCGKSYVSSSEINVDMYVWEIQYSLPTSPDPSEIQTMRGTVHLIR